MWYRVVMLVCQLGAFFMACWQLWNHDYMAACAWFLAEISMSLTTMSERVK